MSNRRLPDRLTDDNVTDVNFFKDDLEEMYKATDEISDLADKVQNDLDEIYFNSANRQVIGRGVMSYASSAIENLATLRTAKCTSLNQILTNKLKVAQLAMNKKKNSEDGGIDSAAISREFNKLFVQHAKEIAPANPQNDIMKRVESADNFADDVDLSNRIDELEKSGELEFTDNEQAIKYEKRGVVFKVTGYNKGSPKLVACAQDNGEQLVDYPSTLIPSIDLSTSSITKEGHLSVGVGKEYEVLS